MSKTDILEIRDLSFNTKGTQLSIMFNFKLKKGSIHSILFKDKNIKKTLISILRGQNEFEADKIIFKGQFLTNKKDLLKLNNDHQFYLINRYSAISPEKKLFKNFNFKDNHNSAAKSRIFPGMTVAENIFFGREPLNKFIFFESIDNKKMINLTSNLFAQFGLDLSPTKKMDQLKTVEKQLVALVKAFSYEIEILLIDQAAIDLNKKDEIIFFDFVQKLKCKGVSIIYLTQKIERVLKSSDYVTILNKEKTKAAYKVADLDFDSLSSIF